MGLENDVTTFTASDFGRTLSSNNEGTDQSCGNHHIVMCGAVKGGDIYEQSPIIGSEQQTMSAPAVFCRRFLWSNARALSAMDGVESKPAGFSAAQSG
ncbi:DUF1501 domain-containing protein [Granulicella sp. 5B5]|uniref:DUF1501 domain-containing protein n=1 Tax=Granulicella sp. 5B5 TaxID=1617967 RepID=UPI0015F6C9E0|nr:DUF1501 domain-containing protein [Granulicella sp. 5B5]QMV18388.1 DUF1501 domain-containing protein [Granulicella sp. 5B5]